MLPFSLLGLGLDNHFEVITKLGEVGVPGSRLTIPHQLTRTMQTCGLAITMCIIASASVGVVGSSSTFPAITQYCYYSVRSLALNYSVRSLALILCCSWLVRCLQSHNTGPAR
jgi:Sterol-sensing domain of SREBP cleavage-activation